MKNLNYIQKQVKKLVILICILIVGVFQACRDDVTDDIITEEVLQIASYLESDPATFSEFSRLLEDAGLYDLLSTYGAFTCFIPTNTAILKYYENNGISYEDLDKEAKEEIVKNHIIRGRFGTSPIQALDFPNDLPISTPNMNNNFIVTNLRVPTEENPYRYAVNDSANIIVYDIGLLEDLNDPSQVRIHNGIIHLIDRVLEAPSAQLAELLANDESFLDFQLFIEAFEKTGLIDSLYRYLSDYVDLGPQQSGLNNEASVYYDSPPFKRYGYTVFMESDATLARKGIYTFDDLVREVANLYGTDSQTEGSNFEDRGHSLNQFIGYHILTSMRLARGFIPNDYYEYYVSSNPDIYEYAAPYCPNTLIEFRNGSNGTTLINKPTNQVESDSHTRIVGNIASTANVSIIEIDNLIYYNSEVEDNVFNKRMRMDAASLLDELISNNFRMDFNKYILPMGFLERITFDENTKLHYLAQKNWGDMYGDELNFTGKYDFTVTLLPIPAGTYEIRVAYTANPNRAVSQVFFDGAPVGIPLDMRLGSQDAKIGWAADTNDEEANAAVDKRMKNRGYMKGPNSIWMHSNHQPLRENVQSLRRIMTTATFTSTAEHKLRVKSVEENIYKEFHFDFLEVVPTSYLEFEGRD